MLQKHKQYRLTGVSHVIPFIACGGILIAVSLAYCFQFHLVKTITEKPAAAAAEKT